MDDIAVVDETVNLENELRVARKKLDIINPTYAEKIMMGKSLGTAFDTCAETQEFRQIYQKLRVLKMHSKR